jgi:stromal membrane-associated protein
MGTHISRVKSVDLDAWTDEQTQSMIRWGNAKANKYWEAKLAPDHVPSDGKIDNFVRTKYASQRWVSSPNRPDPDSLSGDDEPVPVSQPDRKAPASINAKPVSDLRQQAAPSLLDFGSEPDQMSAQKQPASARPEASLDAFTTTTPTPSIQAETSKKSNVSLFSNAVPAQPAQNTGRNDLKMSIMSLYASAPRAQAPVRSTDVGVQMVNSRASPQQSTAQKGSGAFDDLNGLFGNVSFAPSAPQARQDVGSNSSTGWAAQTVSSVSSNVWQSSMSTPANDWSSSASQMGSKGGSAPPKQPSAFDDLYSTSDVWK